MLIRSIVMIFMFLGIGAASAADLQVPTFKRINKALAPKKVLTVSSPRGFQVRKPKIHGNDSVVRPAKRREGSVTRTLTR